MNRAAATDGCPRPSRRSGRRRLRAAWLLLVLLGARPATALVTVPWTLWDLTWEADLVVLARVEMVLPPRGLSQRVGLDIPPVAALHVEESWKGRSPAIVLVAFEPTICPDSPVYLPGEMVVAFLERAGWLLPMYRTVGLSFGTRYPSPAEVGDVRAMVRKVLARQRSGASVADLRREWMVEAAARSGTRWDGLYGLASWTSYVHWSSPDRPAAPVVYTGLTEQELASIIEGFVETPPVDLSLPMALALLAGRRDARIDEGAVSAIDDLLARDWEPSWYRPGWLLDAMALVLERYGDRDPAARLAPLKEGVHFVEPAALEAVWKEAKAELAIPE